MIMCKKSREKEKKQKIDDSKSAEGSNFKFLFLTSSKMYNISKFHLIL